MKAYPLTKLDNLICEHYRTVHAIRVALAFLAIFLVLPYIEKVLHLAQAEWILVTFIVVMGPVSYLGNVIERVLHRIGGTLLGIIAAIISILIGEQSYVLMLIWTTVCIYVSAYLALGRYPYMGLLIGLTMMVFLGGSDGNISYGLWRGVDIIIGSVFALIFCLIYPQRAYADWRFRLARIVASCQQMYAGSSRSNALPPKQFERLKSTQITQFVKLSTLIGAINKETKIDPQAITAIHVKLRNIIHHLELVANPAHSVLLSQQPQLQKDMEHCMNLVQLAFNDIIFFIQNTYSQNDDWSNQIATGCKEVEQRLNQHPGDIPMALQSHIWLTTELLRDLHSLKTLLVFAINLPQKKDS
ncbi:FUSC family protein [Paraferrimonas haliotis]|uniref:FUSC family protein n=1 Tax=Paraferrimonas haliotis TaxID=2013866 RepID=A0AA37WXM1_9GAMM|nr:FUSC family protein [Paraferrimonas haliotis]GLS83584.1 FUSC family protein [Paraferrimonas haliotis]